MVNRILALESFYKKEHSLVFFLTWSVLILLFLQHLNDYKLLDLGFQLLLIYL
jgi:hypothetical protein